MKKFKFEIILGAALIVFYLIFSYWHSQGGGKLTKKEIDQCMSALEKLPLPPEEKQKISSRIRPWAEADDGKPVYMFNLIHFYPELRTFEGAPSFEGSPREANKYYEKNITGLWLTHASYPIFMGHPDYKNLINIVPERTWDELAIARYPNRRTFLKLLSDPAYAPLEPYKFMSLEIDLVPVEAELVIPDLRLIFGTGLVFIFLLTGWIRSARR